MFKEISIRGGGLNSGFNADYVYVDDYWRQGCHIVLIVEDHQLVRDGLRRIIRDVVVDAEVEFLESSTFAEACEIVEARKGAVDLVLLGIDLPDASAGEEVERLKSEWTALPVVVVSACEDWELAADFLRAGALGFVPKSSHIGVMVNAFRLILSGGRYFPPQVLRVLTNNRGSKVRGADVDCLAPCGTLVSAPGLSPRQKEVLMLMLRGRSNKEIARELGVSVGTAKNYVAAVLRSYNASSRSQVISAALNGGSIIPAVY